MTVRIEKLKLSRDARGAVFEPLPPDQLIHQKNTHVVISVPGAVRGNHYHRRGREIIAVHGPALVRYRDGDKNLDVRIAAEEVYRFDFPPRVPHAILNTGTEPNLLVAFNTEVHDPGNPDVVREVLIAENSVESASRSGT